MYNYVENILKVASRLSSKGMMNTIEDIMLMGSICYLVAYIYIYKYIYA